MDLEIFIRLPRLWQWSGTAVLRKIDGEEISCPGEDCTTYAATWVFVICGVDPAADLRGTYSTAEEANAIVTRAGGIVGLVGSRIEPLGWRRIDDLRDGDIGIVKAITALDFTEKEIPAIRFGPLWSVMSARGAMTKKLDWTGVAWRRL
jgi:hypothetical protein